MTLAVAAHVAHQYGGMRPSARPAQGGLAPWQQKRACEALAASLVDGVGLREVAAECGVSMGHFCRAFRRSTGVTPHTWLLRHRIDAAKAMMKDTEIPLTDVALACGFADQSHFTRSFARHEGIPPGRWRRCTKD